MAWRVYTADGNLKQVALSAPYTAIDWASNTGVLKTLGGVLSFISSPMPVVRIVNVATSSLSNNPTSTYANGTAGVGATLTANATGVVTIDGHTVVLNDRVLIKNQPSTVQNGIYKCTTQGAVGVAQVLTRATDSDTPDEIVNTIVISTDGINYYPNGIFFNYNFGLTLTTIGTDPIDYIDLNAKGMQISQNQWTNVNDFLAASLLLPTAPGSTDGGIGWDTTNDILSVFDGSIARAMNPVGWAPYAGLLGGDNTQAFATAVNLAANGGTAACQIYVPTNMELISVTLWNTDTTLARTWGWDLYVDRNNSGNNLNRVATGNANETFTAAAASRRTIVVSGSPVQLGPGYYVLAIQNRHATNTLGLGTQPGGGTGLNIPFKTKTLTVPNGATLDIVTATWTVQGGVPGTQLKGNIAGAAW